MPNTPGAPDPVPPAHCPAPAQRGLFSPADVTWQVHTDPIMAVGGLRALFLQSLHPLAMAGVAQHSGYRSDPWGRLMRTARYIGAVTYGTVAEAEQAGAVVRAVHARVRGVEPTTGQPYSADDPELLRWISCSETDSFLDVYRRATGNLSDLDADRYVAEQRRVVHLVGLDPAGLPGTVAELEAYFAGVRPQLRLTPAARDAALFVLRPPMRWWVGALTPARPAWVLLTSLAFATLPPWARRMYRLPGLPIADIAATFASTALRRALLSLPAELREGPHVKAARARLSA